MDNNWSRGSAADNSVSRGSGTDNSASRDNGTGNGTGGYASRDNGAGSYVSRDSGANDSVSRVSSNNGSCGQASLDNSAKADSRLDNSIGNESSVDNDFINRGDNNWTIAQTKQLFDLAYSSVSRGEGLNCAFLAMSVSCKRSVNSVRNYYYSQLKMFELVPGLADDLGITVLKTQRKHFEFFTDEEINQLIETILLEKAKGRSVRSIIIEMAQGDEQKALRLQNKFRSMIVHHKEKILRLMNSLAERGIVYYNPYTKQTIDGSSADNIQKLNDYIQKLDASEVGGFLNILKKLI